MHPSQAPVEQPIQSTVATDETIQPISSNIEAAAVMSSDTAVISSLRAEVLFLLIVMFIHGVESTIIGCETPTRSSIRAIAHTINDRRSINTSQRTTTTGACT